MKYYSEVLGKMFDTEEAAFAAERKHKESTAQQHVIDNLFNEIIRITGLVESKYDFIVGTSISSDTSDDSGKYVKHTFNLNIYTKR